MDPTHVAGTTKTGQGFQRPSSQCLSICIPTFLRPLLSMFLRKMESCVVVDRTYGTCPCASMGHPQSFTHTPGREGDV